MIKYFIFIFIASYTSYLNAKTYENPYNSVLKFSVGGYKITNSNLISNKEGSYNEVTKKEVYYREIINNGELERRKLEKTTNYSDGRSPESTIMYGEQFDNKTIRIYADINDYDGLIFDATVGKIPTSNLLEVGYSWNKTEFTSISLGDDSFKVHGLVTSSNNFVFEGVENIETPWGTLLAAKIRKKEISNITFDNGYGYEGADAVKFSIIQDPSTKETLTYFIRGLGAYKSVSSSTRGKIITTTQNLRTGQISTFPDQEETIIEEVTFLTSNMSFTPMNFIELTSNSQANSASKVNSWTWNEKFPWVYNHSTNSWFYYSFMANSYALYDAQKMLWFLFDSDSSTWVSL